MIRRSCATYTNYLQSHSSHIDILRDNFIYDYSYTYTILSHLSISGDLWYASLLTMAVTILSWEAVSLLIKLQAILSNTTFYGQYKKYQARAGVSGDVHKTLECITITDTKISSRVMVRMTPKSTFIHGVTIWFEQLDFLPQ